MTERTPGSGTGRPDADLARTDRSDAAQPETGAGTDHAPVGPPDVREPARRGWSSLGADLLDDLFVNPVDPGYADAAERRRLDGPVTGRRHLVRRTGTVAVLLSFGLLISMAYQQVTAEAPEAARTRAELVEEVVSARDNTEALERRAQRLREQVVAERDRALGGGDEVRRLRALETDIGLAAVNGPGMAVTLADAPPRVDPVTGEPEGENLGRVLDRDLQRVANTLWASGAEAVAIDGRRLSPLSTIRAAGEAILVDFTPVKSPYVVDAIGPPVMRERFDRSRTAEQLDILRKDHRMRVDVADRDELHLRAATEPQLRHAEPVEPSPSAPRTGGGR